MTFYSNFANPNLWLKMQACFSQVFTNVNNICLCQSTSKTHVSTYKLYFLYQELCVFVYRPVKRLHSAPLRTTPSSVVDWRVTSWDTHTCTVGHPPGYQNDQQRILDRLFSSEDSLTCTVWHCNSHWGTWIGQSHH